MSLDACFLSIDEDKPLGVWWADREGCGVIDLESFLKESMIDMSPAQAARYASRLKRFVHYLEEYASLHS